MKTKEEYEKIISELSESNYTLSMKMAGFTVGNHITHLFGIPLNKIADIIDNYKDKVMFNGEFKIGGKSRVKDHTIKLYRNSSDTEKYPIEDFKKSIAPECLAWDKVNKQLLYRGIDGQLWKAKFEETDG